MVKRRIKPVLIKKEPRDAHSFSGLTAGQRTEAALLQKLVDRVERSKASRGARTVGPLRRPKNYKTERQLNAEGKTRKRIKSGKNKGKPYITKLRKASSPKKKPQLRHMPPLKSKRPSAKRKRGGRKPKTEKELNAEGKTRKYYKTGKNKGKPYVTKLRRPRLRKPPARSPARP